LLAGVVLKHQSERGPYARLAILVVPLHVPNADSVARARRGSVAAAVALGRCHASFRIEHDGDGSQLGIGRK
jgi:hypothetical protein